jgi:hypothetical protein
MKIRRLSPKTIVCDVSKLAQDYLKSLGLEDYSKIGKTPVFVRYEGRMAVAVGPTAESVAAGSSSGERPEQADAERKAEVAKP